MFATVKQIAGFMEKLAPISLALPGDPVGLQVGNPFDRVENVLVALEVDGAVLDEAVAKKVGLVVTHHPLIFDPLQSVDESKPQEALLASLIRRRIAVYSAHTNLDAAPLGVNYILAERLGLAKEGRAVLEVTGRDQLLKLVVFVPSGYEDKLLEVIASAGAGLSGHYSHSSFQVSGTGRFKPLQGSAPFMGRPGRLEQVEEKRLETILPRSRRDAVVRALLEAHPYEEPAYDLYPLALEGEELGMGLTGSLGSPRTLAEIAACCRKALALKSLRCWAPPGRKFSRMALCGGSGGSLVDAAAAAGAEIFISGDFRYHDLKKARAHGLGLIDAGHSGTELPVVGYLAAYLNGCLLEGGFVTSAAAAESLPSEWFMM